MTLREKQIDEFANSQVDCEFFNEDLYEGIIIGAKWADKNPKDGMVSIDNACEWLRNNIDFYVETKYDEDFRVDIEQLLKDICKAMGE